MYIYIKRGGRKRIELNLICRCLPSGAPATRWRPDLYTYICLYMYLYMYLCIYLFICIYTYTYIADLRPSVQMSFIWGTSDENPDIYIYID